MLWGFQLRTSVEAESPVRRARSDGDRAGFVQQGSLSNGMGGHL